MVSKKISASRFTKDVVEFIKCLNKHAVEYVIVGGQAVIFYGHSRLTGDIDFFYNRSDINSRNLFLSLMDFWSGDIPGVKSWSELSEKDLIIQFGVPPNRIDLLSDIGEIEFREVWDKKVTAVIQADTELLDVYFIGLDYLIMNKESVGRPRDQEDLKFLKSIKLDKQK